MIGVAVEVVSDAALSMVTVRAESIRRAVEIAKEHNPSCNARVTFPIDPEAFFVSNPAAAAVGLYEEQAAQAERTRSQPTS